MCDNEARLRELGSLAVQGLLSDEEFAELALLSRGKQQARAQRADLITDLRASMLTRGVTVHDLFTAAEIAAAARSSVVSLGTRVTRAPRASAPDSSQKTWVRQKTGVPLIQIDRPGTKGMPCRYCKGQLLAPYVPSSLKQLDDGKLEANLERYYTDEGKQYFATDAGRAELARLVEYVRGGKIKPKR